MLADGYPAALHATSTLVPTLAFIAVRVRLSSGSSEFDEGLSGSYSGCSIKNWNDFKALATDSIKHKNCKS